MPTQKVFKHRVRERMSKTGESYTSARRQLIHKAETASRRRRSPRRRAGAAPEPEVIEAGVMLVADESMVNATGRTHAEWFALLDAWGATGHTHTEIARWLGEEQGVASWWTQNVTVAYERARGMRARHQMADGFSVSVTRTVDVGTERALAAFTDPALRARWLPDAPLTQRPTKAALTRAVRLGRPAVARRRDGRGQGSRQDRRRRGAREAPRRRDRRAAEGRVAGSGWSP